MERVTLITKPVEGYELLDSGGEEKLERFGEVVLARPDPQSLWPKHLPEAEWQKAHATYIREGEGKWKGRLEKEWHITFGGLTFILRPNTFKHTGLFPEQLSNWEFIAKAISQNILSKKSSGLLSESSLHDSAGQTFPQEHSAPSIQVLNLFGYTGGATLAAAKAGAEVTHVDASKTAVAWARENAAASGLEDKPIRFMVDDAVEFVKKEIKRGKKYDGIIMDPPAFGHGPKNELWKIEENFIELVELCKQLLSDKPIFFLINGYAAGYSPLAFAYNLEDLVGKYGGEIEYGDVEIEEKGSGRVLPAGIFARWQCK
jgi:23S rRNA (cytosine1962-C5)-methyltransferase